MKHRHLNHSHLTAAAIDNIISRGRWRDWVEMRGAALENPDVLRRVEKICGHYADIPHAQRFHFWMHYAAAHRQTA